MKDLLKILGPPILSAFFVALMAWTTVPEPIHAAIPSTLTSSAPHPPAIYPAAYWQGSPCGVPGSGYPDPFGVAPITGGQGQNIVQVTNLNNSGAGSLREAVAGSNRCIVFTVGGEINLSSAINVSGRSNVTIDALTAPSPGITLKRFGIWVRDSSTNVVVRGPRVRCADPEDISDWTDCPSHAFVVFSGENRRVAIVNTSSYGAFDTAYEVGPNSSATFLSNIIGPGSKWLGDPDCPTSPCAANWHHEYSLLVRSSGGNPARAIIKDNILANNWSRNPQISCGTVSCGEIRAIVANNLIWGAQARGVIVRKEPSWASTTSADIRGNYMYMAPTAGAPTPAPQWVLNRIAEATCYADGNYAHSANSFTGSQIDAQCNLGAPGLDWIESESIVSAIQAACNAVATAGARGENFGLDSVDQAILAGISLDGECAPPEPPPVIPTEIEITGTPFLYKSAEPEEDAVFEYTTPSGDSLANFIVTFFVNSDSTPFDGDVEYKDSACPLVAQSIAAGVTRQATLHVCWNPDPGAANVELPLATAGVIESYVFTLDPVEQDTGIRDFTIQNSTTGVGTFGISTGSEEGDWAGAFMVAGAAGDPANGAGQTALFDGEDFSTRSGAGGWKDGRDDSTPFVFNLTGTVSPYAAIAFSVIPADAEEPEPEPGEIEVIDSTLYIATGQADNHSFSVTVPSGENRAHYTLAAHHTNTSNMFGANGIQFDSVACPLLTHGVISSDSSRVSSALCPAPVGTYTLNYHLGSARFMGAISVLLTGVDQDTPVRDHDGTGSTSSEAGGSVTSDSEESDVMVGMFMTRTDANPINSSSGGQEDLYDQQVTVAASSRSYAAGWKPGGASSTTLNFVSGTGNSGTDRPWSAAGAVFIAAAVEPDPDPEPDPPLITIHGGDSLEGPDENDVFEFTLEDFAVDMGLDGGYLLCGFGLTRSVGTVDLGDITLIRGGTEILTPIAVGGAAGAGAISVYLAAYPNPGDGQADIVLASPSQAQRMTMHCETVSGVRIVPPGPIRDAVSGGSAGGLAAENASVGCHSQFGDLVVNVTAVGGSPGALVPNQGQLEWHADSAIGGNVERRFAMSARYADDEVSVTQTGYSWGTEDIFSTLCVTLRFEDGSPAPEAPGPGGGFFSDAFHSPYFIPREVGP